MAELAFAVPQVVAHRVTRMALAGTLPSPRDRKEFALMSAEKTAAFQESWAAMTWQAALAQQQFALGLMRSAAWPLGTGRRPTLASSAAELGRAGLGVLGHGLAPVHKRAVANAKRLGTTRLK